MKVRTMIAAALALVLSACSGDLRLANTTKNVGGQFDEAGATGSIAAVSGPKFFVIGTFVPPAHLFGIWKQRGINTVVEVPAGNDMEAWSSAAVSNGLYMIRAPRSNPALDANQPYLLMWAHEDEPSNVKPGSPGVDYNTVLVTPDELQRRADSWRASLPAGVTIPIYLNLTGGHVTDRYINETIMRDYSQGGEADIIVHDSYTVNMGREMIYSQDGYYSTLQGHAIDRLTAWSGGKPQMAYIESSDYDNNGTTPDPGQMRAQIWSSVIHGATGIIYFPVRLSPWAWDATPAANAAEMAVVHAKLRELQSVLIDPSTGKARGTLLKMANPGAAPSTTQLPYPFEGRLIPTAQGTMYVVLNLSPSGAATLNAPSLGLNNVSFGRYEVKFGTVPASTVSPAPAPVAGEPSGSTPPAGSVAAGTYNLIAKHSSKCADIEAVSTAEGAKLIQYDCWGGKNQQFAIKHVSNNQYQIVAAHSGKCVGAAGGQTGNLVEIEQVTCDSSSKSQLFTFTQLSSGAYHIKAAHSGRCLDVLAVSLANSARLIQYDCHTSSMNQNFALKLISAPSSTVTGLIKNPGFEQDLASWRPFGSGTGVTTTGQRSGFAALQLTSQGGGVDQTISGAVAGATYRLSGHSKTTNTADIATYGLHFLSSTGTSLVSKWVLITSSGYQAQSLDLVAPTGTVAAKVFAYKNGGSSAVHVDDLKLEKIADPTATPSTPATPTPPPTTGVPSETQVGYLGSLSALKPKSQLTAIAGVSVSGTAYYIRAAGTVVDGFDLRGAGLIVQASNVTIRNCIIDGGGNWWGIRQESPASGMVVENVTFDGQTSANNTADMINSDLRATIRRSKFIKVKNDAMKVTAGLVEANCVIGAGYGPGAHGDGIQMPRSTGPLTIRNNVFDLRVLPGMSVTSTLWLAGFAGPIDNVVIEGNRLLGGGYTVGFAHSTNITFRNNRLGGAQYGYNYALTTPIIQSGNVDHFTGAPIVLK